MPEGDERWVLDSYAILAWLGDEPAAAHVAHLLARASGSLYMSAINVGEVYYLVSRRRGLDQARAIEDALYDHPNVQIADATRRRVRAAADIKVSGRLSLADAFAAALALELDARLLTGDPEFRPLENDRGLRIDWLDTPEARE